MEPGRPAGARRSFASRLLRFLSGLGYLALVALVLSGVTEVDFLPMFLAVVAGAALCTTLAIVWLTCSALREDARPGQFGLGSLFFLTTFAAIFFGVVRWLVVHCKPFVARGAGDSFDRFLALGIACLLLGAIAVPFLVVMAENLVWAAVWPIAGPMPYAPASARKSRPPKGVIFSVSNPPVSSSLNRILLHEKSSEVSLV